ncbi:MAG: SCP2 sterol-binding domain-containing protein [Hyphomicrobiales bacterium]
MTWQGGKLRREMGPISEFAPLKSLAAQHDDPSVVLKALAEALSEFPDKISLHVRLVSGDSAETVQHWDVQGGSKNAKALQKEPKKSDVTVVMRPETLMEIAQGRLAPYEALYSGRLRVGGNMDAAKAIVEHLTDPTARYRAPC